MTTAKAEPVVGYKLKGRRTDRNVQLDALGLEERFIKWLKTLGWDEAKWIVQHEYKVEAQRNLSRFDFLIDELAEHYGQRVKPKAPTIAHPFPVNMHNGHRVIVDKHG